MSCSGAEKSRYHTKISRKKKIKKFWYLIDGVHVVQTERYGNDKRKDWVAVKDEKDANWILNGGKLRGIDVLWVGNRLKDFRIDDCDFLE